MNMMNKCAKFHGDDSSGKKLNSISRVRVNFRRRPFLCTTLHRNPIYKRATSAAAFDQLFFEFLMQFSQKMRLYVFYTVVHKK